jgi:diamine N-acetyltransferase
MPEVSLRPITNDNVRAVCDLELAPGQEDLIAPAATTIAEAHYEPTENLVQAIYVDETPAGLVAVLFEDPPYLVRFMVDAAHQRQGFGTRALELLYEELRARGYEELTVSWNPREGGPGDFWRGQGFAETGQVTYGEPVGRLAL